LAASNDTDADRLSYLAWLIAETRLDVKIAIPIDSDGTPKAGIYHEKLGLFDDTEGNSVAFTGSPNETVGGLVENFEAIDVFCSWDEARNRAVRKSEN